MKLLITTDSVCDIPQDIVKELDLNILSIPITLGEKTLLDGVEVTSQDIFDFVDKFGILPKTSAINEFAYTEFFEKHLKTHDEIIHFTISSGASSCYDNAKRATQNMPNVHVIDTKTLSGGVGLLILKAFELKNQGKTAKEIIDYIEQTKLKLNTSFVIEKLDFLHKGGRCSSLQLLGANLLKIRPSIKVKDGVLVVHKKYKGKMHDVVRDFMKDTMNEYESIDKSLAFVVYSSATEEMLNEAKQAVENAGFEKVIFATASGTITSHCGPNTLGVMFLHN